MKFYRKIIDKIEKMCDNRIARNLHFMEKIYNIIYNIKGEIINMSCTLVIMAAGLGTRFVGGIKQLEPFGPNGEIIMDYSIYDAVEAGFDKVVFIIRKDIRAVFDEMIGNRISAHVKVDYVYQETDCLPTGFTPKEKRTKPWGHGHAVCCCKGVVNEPFAVINADDFYGKEAFVKLHDFLVSGENDGSDKLHLAMAGFVLKNTLSEHGSVNRGVCQLDQNNMLSDVQETYNIRREADGQVYSGKTEKTPLSEDCYVSMNMWGCPSGFIDSLEKLFEEFLKVNVDSPDAEFLLPAGIDSLIKSGKADCKLLESNDRWFGVTYMEDKPSVQAAISELIESGKYPAKLWD
jgi:choline kinase